jgi:hypothetical protein
MEIERRQELEDWEKEYYERCARRGHYFDDRAPYSEHLVYRLSQDYSENKDPYAALIEIGLRPLDPPTWALGVCAYEAARFKALPRSSGRGRTTDQRTFEHELEDERLLARMADLVCDGSTVHAAAKEVTGETTDGPAIRRLQRKWKEQSEVVMVEEETGKPVAWSNRWLRQSELLRGKIQSPPPKRKPPKRRV